MKKILFWTILLVMIDQASKFAFEGKTYFSGIVSINYTANYGAAFGILQGQTLFFIMVALIVIAGILYYRNSFQHKAGMILLLAGSVGNLIDRVALGYVRDFIAVQYFSIFNLADVFNVAGVALIFYFSVKNKNT